VEQAVPIEPAPAKSASNTKFIIIAVAAGALVLLVIFGPRFFGTAQVTEDKRTISHSTEAPEASAPAR
jgi:3-hydroxyisobutyrate dehydrogenase-like beta-hydroxyacid dehydrogenase